MTKKDILGAIKKPGLARKVTIIISIFVLVGVLKIPGLMSKRNAENKTTEIYLSITNNEILDESIDYCDTREQGPFGGGNRWCGRYALLDDLNPEQTQNFLSTNGWRYTSESERHAKKTFGSVYCDVYLDETYVFMPDDVRANLNVNYTVRQPVSYLFCIARS